MSGLGTALRIARRDAWQHRGRSLLVMTMIALPVLAVVAGDILIRSGEQTPAERVHSQLADADAWVVAPAGVRSVTQSWFFHASVPITVTAVPDSHDADSDSDGGSPDLAAMPLRPASQVLSLLPPGSQITRWRHIDFIPVKAAGAQYVPAAADLLDITSPAAGGRYRVLRGAAPAKPGQIALTSHLAARLGVGVGDTVMAGAPEQRYSVTAVVQAAATTGSLVSPGQADAVVAMPDAVHFIRTPFDDSDAPRYLVTTPVPLTLERIDRLNHHGIGVYSRAVAGDPALRARVDPPSPAPLFVAGLVVGLAMAIMQVIFLAGPAFAIGARRMRRQFGQLVATGARPSQLRSVVLATGLVLGTVGAAGGLVAGVGVGAVLRVTFRSWLGYHSPGLHLVPTELIGIAALGVVTALLAALIPAITAGRASALSLLGRQPDGSRPARWWSLAGIVLASIGLLITVWMAARQLPDDAGGPAVRDRGLGLAAGVALMEIGLLLAVPWIVHLASLLGHRLPTAGRLALRDADRHRSRTAPAIAAVTVCATAAVLVAVLLSSAGAYDRSRYVAGIPVGDVQVDLSAPGSASGDATGPAVTESAASAVRALWPRASILRYSTVNDRRPLQGGRGLLVPRHNLCPYSESRDHITAPLISAHMAPSEVIVPPDVHPSPPTAVQMAEAGTDWRCFGRAYSTLTARQAHVHRPGGDGSIIANTGVPTIVVGGPTLRRALTGVSDPVADAALTGGGAVVLDRTFLAPDGTVSSAVLTTDPEQVSATTNPDGSAGTSAGEPDSPGTAVPAAPAVPRVTRTRSVPAVLGRWSPTPLGVILSPQAAHQLGWSIAPGGLIVQPAQAATTAQAHQLALAVQASTGHVAQASVETGTLTWAGSSSRGPLSALLIVIALLAAGTIVVVAALGLADSRSDLATLAAIGAPPRIRRLVTGWTAAMVTLLGCLLGGVVGLVPAWGLLRLMQTIQGPIANPIIVPWGILVALLITIPLAAFAIGVVLPRSRLPMVARID